MNMKSILRIFTVATALFVASGCDTNFEEINIDPTKLSPANMNFNYLFTSAQMITSGNSDANGYEDWRNNLIYGATMIQHLSSTTGYWAGDKYTYNPSYNSAYWDANYPNSIKYIVDVTEQIKDDPARANFYHIARIFKVFMFQRMTDMYGDIPYFQAGKGYTQGVTRPVYDPQSAIYDDMLNELKSAAESIDVNGLNTLGDADLMYSGDPVKWKKFAYSEMVRVAMRLSKVDPSKASEWVKVAVNGGVFTSNDDNALVQHQAVPWNQATNGNGWILADRDPDATRVSKTFIDLLKNTDDPRLPFIATVSANPNNTADKGNNDPDIQIGQPNGYDLGNTATNIENAPNWPGNQNLYSIVNRNTFSRLDAPTFFLTHGETQLLLAEARERGWITTGTTEEYYNEGVTASILQLNQTGATLTSGDAETYLTNNPFDAGNALEQINTQYWITTFMDEYEAWANWRRSDFPVLTPVNYIGNVTNGQIPRRFTYPQGEAGVNTANYQEAVSRIAGGDVMSGRVWWDKP